MANTKSSATSDERNTTADREVVITRIFNAPRELVFSAWIDPEHIGEWYGPDGFTITTYEHNVKVGGLWRFVMHGPDGVDYPNLIRYDEIKRPERLVITHGGETLDGPGHFKAIITFKDKEGKTELEMRSIFESKEARDFVVREFKAIEGGNQTLNRLEEYLRNN